MILVLTVVGFVTLIAGALYFGAPAFGWIIMIAIIAVYLVEQISAIRKMKQIISEDEIIDACEKRLRRRGHRRTSCRVCKCQGRRCCAGIGCEKRRHGVSGPVGFIHCEQDRQQVVQAHVCVLIR